MKRQFCVSDKIFLNLAAAIQWDALLHAKLGRRHSDKRRMRDSMLLSALNLAFHLLQNFMVHIQNATAQILVHGQNFNRLHNFWLAQERV